MKKLIFCSLLGLFLCAAAAAQPLRNSVINTDNVQSSILGEQVDFNVYLPAGYDASSDQTYPVIYLLHGLYGTNVDWATTGHMKNVVDDFGISTPPNLMWFKSVLGWCSKAVDSLNDRLNFRDFRNDNFGLNDLSMGGGGSTVYSQRHPDMFSSCYSMSGWLDNEDMTAKDVPHDKLYIVRQSVREHSALDFIDNADEETVAKLRTVKWFFDCGDDDYLLKLSVDIHFKMNEKGIKNELRVRDGWHSWDYWHTALRLALPFASRNFAL